MKIWRVSDYPDLSGRGGMIASARWHRIGTPVVYCADHSATALLEKLAHLDLEDMPRSYTLLTIEVPESATHRVEIADLPRDWMTNFASTQAIGMEVLARSEHLIVWVPSVLIPYAWNALLNPSHAEAPNCTIVDVIAGLFDPRLIR
jgi:RES domain-containing protein